MADRAEDGKRFDRFCETQERRIDHALRMSVLTIYFDYVKAMAEMRAAEQEAEFRHRLAVMYRESNNG